MLNSNSLTSMVKNWEKIPKITKINAKIVKQKVKLLSIHFYMSAFFCFLLKSIFSGTVFSGTIFSGTSKKAIVFSQKQAKCSLFEPSNTRINKKSLSPNLKLYLLYCFAVWWTIFASYFLNLFYDNSYHISSQIRI